MKALEILKVFADRHESAYGFNNIIVASLGDIKEAVEELTSMEQRIVELEAPKICEGCKYYGLNIGNEYNRNYCTKLNRFTHDAFGCVYYEPKEQK